MTCSSLFKFNTVVVQLLCIGLVAGFSLSSIARGDDDDSGDSHTGSVLAKILASKSDSSSGDYCVRASNALDEADGKLSDCGKNIKDCKAKIAECQGISADEGAKDLDDDDDSTPENICAVAGEKAKACGYAISPPPSDLKDQLRDLKDERRDTIKECNDLTKRSADADTKNAAAANKNSDNTLKSNKEYNQQMLDISKQMRDSLTGMNDANAKAVAQGMAKSDKIRQTGMKLQEELSRKIDAKNTTYVKWQTACLAAAEDARQKVEDKFDQFIQESQKIKKNYAFSSAAGLKLRELKQKLKKERWAYGEMKAKCLGGTKGPGAEMKVAYDVAARDVNTSSVNYQNQTTELQRQDQLNQLQLQQAQQQNYQKYQQAVGDLQQRQQQLATDHGQEMQNEMMKQLRDSGVTTKNTKQTTDDLAKCEKNLDKLKNQIAGTEYQLHTCLPSYGVKSDSALKDKTKKAKDSGDIFAKYKVGCRNASRCDETKNCNNYKLKKGFQAQCQQIYDSLSKDSQDPAFIFDVSNPSCPDGAPRSTPFPAATTPAADPSREEVQTLTGMGTVSSWSASPTANGSADPWSGTDGTQDYLEKMQNSSVK